MKNKKHKIIKIAIMLFILINIALLFTQHKQIATNNRIEKAHQQALNEWKEINQ